MFIEGLELRNIDGCRHICKINQTHLENIGNHVEVVLAADDDVVGFASSVHFFNLRYRLPLRVEPKVQNNDLKLVINS